jgi:YggT family protein
MNPLFNGLAAVIGFILTVIQFLVFASVIVSWIGDRNNTIVQMIDSMTEPMYRPLRRYTSRIPGPFDWAPLAVLAIIIFLQASLVPWLRSLGRGGF